MKSRVWVTWPSRYSDRPKVHAAHCRFAEQSHGFWSTRDDVDSGAILAYIHAQLHEQVTPGILVARCCYPLGTM